MKPGSPKAAVSGGAPSVSTWRWLNVFQYCRVLNILGNIMVLLVLGLVGTTYVAVVVLTYGPVVLQVIHRPFSAIGSFIVCVAFTAVTIMVLWSYLAAVVTDPGKVPVGWHGFVDEQQARVELERLNYSNYYHDRRDPRRPRYCKHCQAWKPERAHHCSVTGRCILRMDHYCIWLVNCVGMMNYKAFLLFLFYSAVGSLAALLLLIKPCVDMFAHNLSGVRGPLTFVVVIISGAFAVSLAGFLVMHGQLLSTNYTTIEMYEKDRCHPWPYNKGLRRNFEETFGRNKPRWFLPFHTKEERRHMLDSALGPGWSAALLAPGASTPGATGGAAGPSSGGSVAGGSTGGGSSSVRLLPHAATVSGAV